MILTDFNKSAKEFEEALQQLASDVTGGVLFERLTPMDLWKHAEASITRLNVLAEGCKELMLILKPEKAIVIEQRFGVFSQALANFRGILFQNSADPLANSRLALEQLRGAIVSGSEFLMLVKEVRDAPSPLIAEVLRLRETLESGGKVVTIEAPESVRPMLERLAKDIEALRSALTSLERGVIEVREHVRILQDDSVRFASDGKEVIAKKVEAKKAAAPTTLESQESPHTGQSSLSQFKN